MELQLMNERRHNKIYNDESYTYKIFNIDYDKKDVFQEAFITSKVEELDAHAPLIDSVYKKDGQWCIKFDLIKGESLFSLINNNPENIKEYINKFLSMKEPSRKLIVNLIDRVEIFEDKSVTVKVTFNNV